MKIFNRDEIEKVIVKSELINAVEEGFRQYSLGNVIVPPVGHLDFEDPPGNVHIKYGAVKGDQTFTIKVANGFYDNPKLGISSSQGVVMVFSQKTGVLEALLFDEGLITDLRTAAAGAVVAKYLAPKKITALGVIGTGIQARLQVEFLKEVLDFDKVYVYGRNTDSVNKYITDMKSKGYTVEQAESVDILAEKTNYIVTTTPSTKPLLLAKNLKTGLHVTAMGADGPGKQEVEAEFIAVADIKVVDSKNQCFVYSDTSFAVKKDLVDKTKVLEIGEIIDNKELGRTNDNQITFADLTGVAVQDIVAAELILSKLGEKKI
jgi:ornithine cyclodeaminase